MSLIKHDSEPIDLLKRVYALLILASIVKLACDRAVCGNDQIKLRKFSDIFDPIRTIYHQLSDVKNRKTQ